MRLARHPLLDALCGEYLLGTMRGAARRRFERALREEPLVTSTLARWRETFATRPSPDAVPAAAELDRGWARLRRELALEPAAQPWWRRAGLWQAWAATATIALAVAVWRDAPQETPTATRPLAELADSGARGVLAASVSPDGRLLELRPS
ncbi:MAG TPA: hypothetical protein VEA81_14140, partial [Burkholderiaceae bacterium]|nr:hypothetical protein [Burkholderiaceae bacterium]